MTTTSTSTATLTATLTRGETARTKGRNLGGVLVTRLYFDGSFVAVESAAGRIFDGCKRCGAGLGVYVFDGQTDACYLCGGIGFGDVTTEADVIRRAIARDKAAVKRQEKAAAEAAAYVAEREAREAAEIAAYAEWLAVNDLTDAAAFALTYTDRPGFLGDMAARIADRVHLTDRQWATLARIAAEEAAKAETPDAGHWGEEGKRAEFTAKVTFTKYLEDNGFGASMLVKMETAEGHVLTHIGSGAFAWEAEVGDVYTGKATVKEHGEYNGRAETKVQRVTAKRVNEG